jgi:hypothetical protein
MSDRSQSDHQDDKGSDAVIQEKPLNTSYSKIDLFSYHETNAGRLVIDPAYVLKSWLQNYANVHDSRTQRG